LGSASASGVLGWLFSLSISKQHILKYEESVKAGQYLVVAHGSAADAEKAKAILAGTKPEEVTAHLAGAV